MDNELRNALRREEPPEGFGDRVIRAAASIESKRDGAHEIRLKADPTYSSQTYDSTTQHSHRDGPQTYHSRTWDPPLGGLTSHMSVTHWAAAAAVVVALAGSGLEYHARQRERAEGEAARARVVLALHIASSKLQLVQTKIARMHEQPGKNSNQ